MTTAETTSGRVAGVGKGSVDAYLGVPYAAALRFQSPRPPASWSGVRPAVGFGPSAVQVIDPMASWIYTSPGPMSEDCLSLNIWAPARACDRPVVVWIHGGGFRTGASAMPLFDGERFAVAANVVLVSINYRNSTLGWLSHPDLLDAETGAAGNWGLQDQVQALAWVRDNIGAFGGDPGQVTVMGQSGGAINAIMIAQNPRTRSLIGQLILLSPPYIAAPGFADQSDAAALAEDLARALGTSVTGLREVSAQELNIAELAQWRSGRVQGRTGRFLRGPVVDGLNVVDWPAALELPDVPTILGYTRNEGIFWTDLADPDGRRLTAEPPSGAAEREACLQFLGRAFDADPAKLASVVDAYFAAYEGQRADAPSGVLAELIGDALLRQYGLRAARRAVRDGHRALHLFDYALPLRAPGRGTPHCAELPVIFGTFDQPHYRAKVGDDEFVRALSDTMIRAFGSFAETGNPSARGLVDWPRFDSGRDTTLTLGAAGELAAVGPVPKAAVLAAFEGLGPQPRD